MRRTIAALLAIALIAVTATALLAGTAGARSHHRRHHSRTHHTSCIPQHDKGDRDADNRGGPSDGDGCM